MSSPPILRTIDRPPAFIVESPQINRNTVILLHGTSSYGVTFSRELMAHVDFGLLLRRTKLVFPSGSLRKTTVFGGNVTHAWFDIADFADRTKGEEQQKEGLGESIAYLGELIQDILDNESHDEKFQVFVGGFSQGCAMSMILLLSGELDKLRLSRNVGGFVGLSGWLPFAKELAQVATIGSDWKERRLLVQKWLRMELRLPPSQPRGATIPLGGRIRIFLAHGTSDEKVKLEWGQDMKKVLESVGYEVEWKDYEGMGHVTLPEELFSMTNFIKNSSKTHGQTIDEALVTSPTSSTPNIQE